MLKSYIELNFDVLKAATSNRYSDADDIRLINLGPIALCSICKMTTNSGKHLENIDHAHIVSLMSKLLSSSRDSDDLSFGFDRSRDRRKRELNKNKTQKGKYHLRNYLKGIFSFAEYQETETLGLSYRVTLTRNTDNAVLNKDNTTNNAKIKTNGVEWYVHLYVPCLEENDKLMNQIAKNTPTNLQYPERSVFMKRLILKVFGLSN